MINLFVTHMVTNIVVTVDTSVMMMIFNKTRLVIPVIARMPTLAGTKKKEILFSNKSLVSLMADSLISPKVNANAMRTMPMIAPGI